MITKKIYPLAGHSNTDPGAIANGYREADLTKELRNIIVNELKKRNYLKFQIDDDKDGLSTVLKKINPGKKDILLDIHFNSASPTATGTEVFISNYAGDTSKNFAKELVDGTSKIIGITNRGVKPESLSARKRLAVLNKNGAAALIEVCFITNANDMAKYQANKIKLAAFIAELLIKYDTL
jgi:N-acetylmuramoyl-L-alanine amidase